MARCFTLVVALQMFAGSAFAQAPDPNRPEPLICKPAGQAPFAVVIWNHGLVRDAATFANAQRGWRNMCEALAAEGYLAYIPIRRFVRNLGPADITREADELSKAVNTVIAMPDVDRTKVAIMGHSRGATLALMVAVKRRDLAAVILTAPAPIPPKFLGDTMDRVRSMPAPVLLMVEKGDELGGLARTDARNSAVDDTAHVLRSVAQDDQTVVAGLHRVLGLQHLTRRRECDYGAVSDVDDDDVPLLIDGDAVGLTKRRALDQDR